MILLTDYLARIGCAFLMGTLIGVELPSFMHILGQKDGWRVPLFRAGGMSEECV